MMMKVIHSSSTNPGSVWFPEVSQTLAYSVELPSQTARNSNFPCLPAQFHFTADTQRLGLVAFCYFGASPQRTGRAQCPSNLSNIDSGNPHPYNFDVCLYFLCIMFTTIKCDMALLCPVSKGHILKAVVLVLSVDPDQSRPYLDYNHSSISQATPD